LTVTDLHRSVDFYSSLFNFKAVLDMGTRVLMHNGSVILAVTLPPDSTQAVNDDSFNENRVGLDHISFSVGSKTDLENAVRLFDEHRVSHGEIKDLGADLRLYVLAFRDPDNIQIELTAPYSA
jgi:catechol 2,3-dioxygenase-like lactoylglutathione lyase family enzyme